MKITISGTPGSGKSTAAKLLAKHFNLKHYSVGDFRGRMALEKGMTIDEFNKLGEVDFSTDKLADEWQKKIGDTEDNFVMDGRLSFYFIPDSIKVFLSVDPDEAAKRVFNDTKHRKREDESYGSVEEAKEALERRIESDKKRYQKYYGINPFDVKHYDIVMDTTGMSLDEMGKLLIEAVRRVAGEIEKEE